MCCNCQGFCKKIDENRRNYRAFAYLMKKNPKKFKGKWEDGVFKARELCTVYGYSCRTLCWETIFVIGEKS
jgi:hypothetical protein